MSERRVTITAGEVSVGAVLNDTKTADAIWEALPLQAKANRWGDEIYFAIPVRLGVDNGQEVVDIGDLAYWPPGNAFCVFWGPTPASRGSEARPASAVNVFGKIDGDATVFSVMRTGVAVRVEKSGD